MNTKVQYTMMKNPETQRQCHLNLNLQLPNIKLLYSTSQPLHKITVSRHQHLPLLSGHLTHTMLISTGNYPPVTCWISATNLCPKNASPDLLSLSWVLLIILVSAGMNGPLHDIYSSK